MALTTSAPQTQPATSSIGKSSPKTGLDFGDKALSAYIRALSNPRFSKNPATFQSLLAAKLTAATDQSPTTQNNTVLHRTIVISVAKRGAYNPADRLSSINVVVRPDPKWRFISWGALATAYTTVNAGTLQFTQTRGITGTASLSTPTTSPVTAGLSVTPSATNALVENLSATERKEDVSVTVVGGSLVVHRDGGYGIDLTGSIVVTADLAFEDPYSSAMQQFTGIYVDKRGKWLSASKVRLKKQVIYVVSPPEDVGATTDMTYTIRHVSAGGGTYEERDDDVLERTVQSAPVMTVIVPSEDVVTPSFGLYGSNGFLSIAKTGYAPVGLCFKTYQEAENMLAYLVSRPGSGAQLGSDARVGFVTNEWSEATKVALRNLVPQAKCR